MSRKAYLSAGLVLGTLAFAVGLGPASAIATETLVIGGEGNSVTVDLSVLDAKPKAEAAPKKPGAKKPAPAKPAPRKSAAKPAEKPAAKPAETAAAAPEPVPPAAEAPPPALSPSPAPAPTQDAAPAQAPVEAAAVTPAAPEPAPEPAPAPAKPAGGGLTFGGKLGGGMTTDSEPVKATTPAEAPPAEAPPAKAAAPAPAAPAAAPKPETPPRMAAMTPALAAGARPIARIAFAEGADALDDTATGQLDGILAGANGSGSVIQVLAYASGTPEANSAARRLSLKRAVAIRSYLIEKGMRAARIDVRALGIANDGGPADRVDLVVLP